MKLAKYFRIGLVGLLLGWMVGGFFRRKEQETGAEYFLSRKADGTPEIIAVQPLPSSVQTVDDFLHFTGYGPTRR